MVFVKTIKNYPIDSNCYVVFNDSDYSCVIIDPGTKDCKHLINFLNSRALKPQYIILTHSHFDHIWGVNELRNLFSVKLVCSSICNNKILDPKKNLSLFYDTVGFKLNAADILIDRVNFVLEWNGKKIKFLNTPGHSDCSISILIENYFFSGDIFIKDILTVVKLPGGNKKKLIETTKIISDLYLDKGFILFPGHGGNYNLNKLSFRFHSEAC